MSHKTASGGPRPKHMDQRTLPRAVHARSSDDITNPWLTFPFFHACALMNTSPSSPGFSSSSSRALFTSSSYPSQNSSSTGSTSNHAHSSIASSAPVHQHPWLDASPIVYARQIILKIYAPYLAITTLKNTLSSPRMAISLESTASLVQGVSLVPSRAPPQANQSSTCTTVFS